MCNIHEFSSEPQFFPPNQHQALDKTMTNLYNIVRKVNYTSGAGKYEFGKKGVTNNGFREVLSRQLRGAQGHRDSQVGFPGGDLRRRRPSPRLGGGHGDPVPPLCPRGAAKAGRARRLWLRPGGGPLLRGFLLLDEAPPRGGAFQGERPLRHRRGGVPLHRRPHLHQPGGFGDHLPPCLLSLL